MLIFTQGTGGEERGEGKGGEEEAGLEISTSSGKLSQSVGVDSVGKMFV